ncbi:hypothetical protein D3C87_1277330 [compost metagenome]
MPSATMFPPAPVALSPGIAALVTVMVVAGTTVQALALTETGPAGQSTARAGSAEFNAITTMTLS